MITLTFKDFYEQKFSDRIYYQLYMIENSQNRLLYVGISKSGVWNRWFGDFGRMKKKFNDAFMVTDSISATIVESLPESYQWTVKLLTIQDCIEQLQEDIFEKYHHRKFDLFVSINDIETMEELFIKKLKPQENYMLNS